jgi:hypothetical protein
MKELLHAPFTFAVGRGEESVSCRNHFTLAQKPRYS